MKKQNKGFTLVELLIVIVIIGILAAIIIPSVSSAIDKANFASDQSDAKNMNTTLLAYCTTNGIDPSELEAPEVRSIVSSQDKNYTFVPKSSNGIFWYNTEKGEIEVTQTGMPTATSKIGNAVYADGTIDSIEEIVDGYLYLNTQGELASWLRNLRNLTSADTYNTLKTTDFASGEFSAYSARLDEIVKEYDPQTTLFINTSGSYLSGYYADKIVWGSELRVIPKMERTVMLNSTEPIRIPATVEVVLPGGLNLSFAVGANTKIEASKNTRFVEGSLSESLAKANSISYTKLDNDKLRDAGYSISITVGTETYDYTDELKYATTEVVDGKETTIQREIFYYNEANHCMVIALNRMETPVEDGTFAINTKAFLAKYPNVTTLSIQQFVKSEEVKVDGEDVVRYVKEYHVQAFDSTGMVLNVIIIVLP